jgi:hypothetical protein
MVGSFRSKVRENSYRFGLARHEESKARAGRLLQ